MLEHGKFIFQSYFPFWLPGWGVSPYTEYFSLSWLVRSQFSGPRLTQARLHRSINVVSVTLMEEAHTAVSFFLKLALFFFFFYPRLETWAWKSTQKISFRCRNLNGNAEEERNVFRRFLQADKLNGESCKEGRHLLIQGRGREMDR